jgi:hypothetical protein
MSNGPLTGMISILNSASQPTVTLDGNTGDISAGGHGQSGAWILKDADGKAKVRIHVPTGELIVAPDQTMILDGATGKIVLKFNGQERVVLTAVTSGGGFGGGPIITLRSVIGKETISLEGNGASLTLRNNLTGKNTVFVDGNKADLFLGGGGQNGVVTLRNTVEHDAIRLDSQTGSIAVTVSPDGAGAVVLKNSSLSEIIRIDSILTSSTDPELPLGGQSGRIVLKNFQGHDSIILNGGQGDIFLQNADCAEEFEVSQFAAIDAGTVVVIDEEGKLRTSHQPYDRKVAGVISGAGNCRPGLVLDKKDSQPNRLPVALVGKVYCKADAQYSAVEVGDLLTTSSTPGHAMKAADPLRAFGAVIGKALGPLGEGRGVIPILIALQ